MTSTTRATCNEVKKEMFDRANGDNGWYDQHNRGTYTAEGFSGDIFPLSTAISFSRLTGDGKYTDKMTFVLTPIFNYPVQAGPDQPGCTIEGCSESQVGSSSSDFSTNYCEQKLLYCGSDEGCNTVYPSGDFKHHEVETQPMAGATTEFSDCLKVAEAKVEEQV